MAGRGAVTATGPQLMALFFAQGTRCAYTGVYLVPGKNAGLDHMTPASRGGSWAIDNLQWVDQRINVMKSDSTHDEFVATCKLIASRF